MCVTIPIKTTRCSLFLHIQNILLSTIESLSCLKLKLIFNLIVWQLFIFIIRIPIALHPFKMPLQHINQVTPRSIPSKKCQHFLSLQIHTHTSQITDQSRLKISHNAHNKSPSAIVQTPLLRTHRLRPKRILNLILL